MVSQKPLGFCDLGVWNRGLGTKPESELKDHVFIIKLSCFWVGSPGTDFWLSGPAPGQILTKYMKIISFLKLFV